MATEFCPRCGSPRTGSFRFCRQCQFDFDQAPPDPVRSAPPQPPPAPTAFSERYAAQPPPTPAPAPAAPARSQAAVAGGIAWIICAALMGYLALQQLGAANTVEILNRISSAVGGQTVSADNLRQTALFNGLGAALTVYFGARLLRNPTRGVLQTSFAWGLLNVGWAAYQINAGVTSDVFIAATIAAGVAGVLSLSAWREAPAKA